ncbi:MAG: hypothetical protein BHW62_10195 [Acinetobacter sp. CAG:196_36_41]|nr:MAG: hypothetical protein BHW62_10195 [Acinetobacter sp. CAG:196_36_41]
MPKKQTKLNKHEVKILDTLYHKMYKSLPNKHVDIFLCGGDVNKDTTRKNVRNILKNIDFLMIFFPEKIFIEYFNLNKEADYLTLETILAENVDYICIVCESPGAYAELGAFVNNKNLQNKIIVLNDEQYKNDPSFINLGPIKHLKKVNKTAVRYYNDNTLCKVCDKLQRFFKQHLDKTKEPRSIDKITGMFYFITLILYLFKGLAKNTLYLYIKYLTDGIKNKAIDFNFDATYSATIKILFNENFIKNKNLNEIELTKTGKDFIYKLIHNNPKAVYNDVISDIIWYKFYHYSS